MLPEKTVLIVDDNEMSRDIAVIALESEYNIICAESAEDMQNKLSDCIPDLILLDLYMPGANGLESIFNLNMNHKWASIPIIFVTCEDDGNIEKEALSCGAVDYIKKPYSAESLRKSVAKVLSATKS